MKPDKNKQKPPPQDEVDDSGDSTSTGGASGEIEFRYHDVASTEQRDDLLTPEEMRRLLTVHKDIHKERVDKQKQTRQERKAMKEGPQNLTTRKAYKGDMGVGYGAGSASKYKTHPIAIKFAGIRDLKISMVPSENTAETNQDLKNELENRLENKLRLNYQPGFNPKPRPY